MSAGSPVPQPSGVPSGPPRVLASGSGAFSVEFDTRRTAAAAARVAALHAAVQARLEADANGTAHAALAGVIETMPTFRSLTVLYDPLRAGQADLVREVLALANDTAERPGATHPGPATGRRWRLPACYEPACAPDLQELAELTGLSPDAVVQHHLDTDFTVRMVGFMPGFAFLGDLPEALAAPRLARPRLQVPAGSVAVTGTLSAVYPWRSPGGWRLIGRCPVRMFDPRAPRPSLLEPGDRVRFEPVSSARHDELLAAVQAAEIGPEAWLEAPSTDRGPE